MMRLWTRWSFGVLGSVLLLVLAWQPNVYGQSNAGTFSAEEASKLQAALDAESRANLAESVLALRESAAGRSFNSAYRASLKARLAGLSIAQLEALESAGGEGNLRALIEGVGTNLLGASSADLVYTPVAPCRVFDTRSATAGILVGGTQRNFLVAGTTGFPTQGGKSGGCGIPFGPATSIIINFAAVTPTGAGNIRAWAVASPQPAAPTAAVMNFSTALPALANGVAVPICDTAATSCAAGDLRLQADVSSVHVVGDVVGYFSLVNRLQVAGIKASSVPTLCPSGLTTTAADISTLTVTFPTSGAAKISGQTSFNGNGSVGYFICNFFEGATSILSWDAWDPGDNDGFYDLAQSRSVTKAVTAGAHTYRLSCRTNSGTAFCAFPQLTVEFFGGGTLP